LPAEKYRIITNRDLKKLNDEVNELASQGFKPITMEAVFEPASPLGPSSPKSSGTIHIMLLEKQ